MEYKEALAFIASRKAEALERIDRLDKAQKAAEEALEAARAAERDSMDKMDVDAAMHAREVLARYGVTLEVIKSKRESMKRERVLSEEEYLQAGQALTRAGTKSVRNLEEVTRKAVADIERAAREAERERISIQRAFGELEALAKTWGGVGYWKHGEVPRGDIDKADRACRELML